MKITFFLNWMGPISKKWYEDNNIPYGEGVTSTVGLFRNYKYYKTLYCCGRIDAHGHPDHPYNYEYSVPVMERESWYSFGSWLNSLVLDYLPESLKDIVNMYEKETGNKIIWFNNQKL